MTQHHHHGAPDVETAIRALPDLTEDDKDALIAMAKAGIEYAAELRKLKARRGLVPICKYTGVACRYDAASCTCCLPGFLGNQPTEWVAGSSGNAGVTASPGESFSPKIPMPKNRTED